MSDEEVEINLAPIRADLHRAFRLESITLIEHFTVSQGSSDGVTGIIIYDHPDVPHKYINAKTEDGLIYTAAMPMSVISLHRHILKELNSAINQACTCLGGGYIKIAGGQLEAYGRSTDFGTGDHTIIEKLFST